jgi:hypothetical protein
LACSSTRKVWREHVAAGIEHGVDIGEHTLKIGRQRLDRRARPQALDRAHGGCVVGGAAVRQIIAIDRGQHDVVELHQIDRACDILGFFGVEPAARVAGIDGTEPAGARADCSHEHDRRRARVPALADIRAFRLFADRAQAMLFDDFLDGRKSRAACEGRAQPRGFAARRGRCRRSGALDAVLDRGKALGGRVLLAAADRFDEINHHRIIPEHPHRSRD